MIINLGNKPKLDSDDKKIKDIVQQAKKYGNKEIVQFKEAFYEFYSKIEDLAIMQAFDVEQLIEALLIDNLINGTYVPLVNAQQISELSKEDYNKYRLELYRSIIEKYVPNTETL